MIMEYSYHKVFEIDGGPVMSNVTVRLVMLVVFSYEFKICLMVILKRF